MIILIMPQIELRLTILINIFISLKLTCRFFGLFYFLHRNNREFTVPGTPEKVYQIVGNHRPQTMAHHNNAVVFILAIFLGVMQPIEQIDARLPYALPLGNVMRAGVEVADSVA